MLSAAKYLVFIETYSECLKGCVLDRFFGRLRMTNGRVEKVFK